MELFLIKVVCYFEVKASNYLLLQEREITNFFLGNNVTYVRWYENNNNNKKSELKIP